nr:WXG100 family type VII secretion target [uncultured Blautia sp.]
MADGILRVTPERLQATASSFESTGNTVRNLTQQMTSIVTGLSGQVWSGEAATSYVTKFNGLQDDIERIHKMIQEHSKDLQEVAQQFITTENANKEMASSLSSDVIV